MNPRNPNAAYRDYADEHELKRLDAIDARLDTLRKEAHMIGQVRRDLVLRLGHRERRARLKSA